MKRFLCHHAQTRRTLEATGRRHNVVSRRRGSRNRRPTLPGGAIGSARVTARHRSARWIAAALVVVVGLLSGSCATAQDTDYFRDVTQTNVPADPTAHILDIDLGDVDGDGDLDALAALENDVNRLYLNDGTGRFTWKRGVFAEEENDSEEVEVADFDGDGRLDVLFIAEHGGHHELYLGEGDGTFRDARERLLGRTVANDAATGDVNGDGRIDVVVGNTGEGSSGDDEADVWSTVRQNFLWLGDPERLGYFVDATADHMPSVNDATQDVKLGDLDGDGDLDMVVGNEVPPNRLLINTGGGVFEDETHRLDLLVPLETREVVLLDVDADADLDVVFANLTSNNGPWLKDPQARLLINDGAGRFTDETASRMPTNVFSSYDAGHLDFDADGDEDLLLCAVQIPGFHPLQVRAYRNDGTGRFTDVTELVIPQETVGRCWDIEVGDVNGDGALDVFIGGWGTQARLLLGRIPQPRFED